MTAAEFRRLALAVPGAVESAHMNHPDFRLGGKIFATLGAPEDGRGMVKLTPEQQRAALAEAPDVFQPCQGAWGRAGSTYVRLAAAGKSLIQPALTLAAANVAAAAKRKKTRS